MLAAQLQVPDRRPDERHPGRPLIPHLHHGHPRDGVAKASPLLLTGISHLDYTSIAAVARVREFARGQLLYLEGDSAQQVVLLTSGLATISKSGTKGTEVILRLSAAGDVLGAVGLFSTGVHFTTCHAFRSCRGLVWDACIFKALVARYPILHQNLVRIFTTDLLELEERFREVATERVAPRVARQLMRLQKTIGRPVDGAIDIGLTREELAKMTGTTLFTVSRLLSAWEERGVVRPRREGVTIHSVQSLCELAEER